MKQSIHIIILLFLSQCYLNSGYSQQVEKREQFNIYYEHLKSGKVCKLFPRKEYVAYTSYDSIGRIKERVHLGDYFKFENESSHLLSRTYDAENHFTKLIYSYTNDSIVDSVDKWQYINQEKSYLISRMIYEYDSVFNLVSRTKLKRDNSIWFKVNYIMTQNYSKYPISLAYIEDLRENQSLEKDHGHVVMVDSLHRPIEILDYNKTGFESLSVTYYPYSNENIETTLEYFIDLRGLANINTTQFNNDDQIVKKTFKSIGNEFESIDIYIYDEMKLLKKIEHLENGKVTWVTEYKYQFYKDK